jgi:hypothetical protein
VVGTRGTERANVVCKTKAATNNATVATIVKLEWPAANDPQQLVSKNSCKAEVELHRMRHLISAFDLAVAAERLTVAVK